MGLFLLAVSSGSVALWITVGLFLGRLAVGLFFVVSRVSVALAVSCGSVLLAVSGGSVPLWLAMSLFLWPLAVGLLN